MLDEDTLHKPALQRREWSPPRRLAQGALQRHRYAASTSSDTLRAIDAKRTINASRARSLVQRMEERNGTRPAVVY
jgi:hypothetical protein